MYSLTSVDIRNQIKLKTIVCKYGHTILNLLIIVIYLTPSEINNNKINILQNELAPKIVHLTFSMSQFY